MDMKSGVVGVKCASCSTMLIINADIYTGGIELCDGCVDIMSKMDEKFSETLIAYLEKSFLNNFDVVNNDVGNKECMGCERAEDIIKADTSESIQICLDCLMSKSDIDKKWWDDLSIYLFQQR